MKFVHAMILAAMACAISVGIASASANPANVPTTVCTAAGQNIVFDGLIGATIYVETHPGSHLGACVVVPPVVVPPLPVTPAAPVFPPNPPARVALCSTTPQKRADGTIGVFQDWLTSDWLLATSPAHNWPLAVYGPKGLFCPDSFNIVGLTDQHVKVDGTGKTNYTGPTTLQGNIYELYK